MYFLQFSSNCEVFSRKRCFAGRCLQLSVPLSVCNAGLAVEFYVSNENVKGRKVIQDQVVPVHGMEAVAGMMV
jgi:hypothetical protein